MVIGKTLLSLNKGIYGIICGYSIFSRSSNDISYIFLITFPSKYLNSGNLFNIAYLYPGLLDKVLLFSYKFLRLCKSVIFSISDISLNLLLDAKRFYNLVSL